jgi:hypothetical protein
VVLNWIEKDGPEVRAPVRQGFGSRLLRPQGGLNDVKLEFRPDGLHCRIVVAKMREANRSNGAARLSSSRGQPSDVPAVT